MHYIFNIIKHDLYSFNVIGDSNTEESNSVYNESTLSMKFSPIKSTDDVIEKGDTATVEKSLSSKLSLSIQFPVDIPKVMSELSVFSLSRGSMSNVDNDEYLSQRYKIDSLASNISFGSSYVPSTNSSLEENESKTLVKLGIFSTINNFNKLNFLIKVM